MILFDKNVKLFYSHIKKLSYYSNNRIGFDKNFNLYINITIKI